MDNNKQQLLERLKTANNILVTVSSDPSVDQLSAAIGLTLMLNKMGKHGTAVFSGKVPSTIEFLQPEKTIEKNTDSLRDFIIALDKSKADKLRYKVEDSHVKIFITPYRTSISDADLEFSQGDFNVEVVVALGVSDQADLDQAITAHGRILHDATTISVTTGRPSQLGSIDWDNPDASSLCEMIAGLANDLQDNLLDNQMATALMTGVVAETERFSNDRTTASTMTISASLMAAGANQQLVATELEAAKQVVEPEITEPEEPEQPQMPEQESTPEPEPTQDVGNWEQPENTNEDPEVPAEPESEKAPEEAYDTQPDRGYLANAAPVDQPDDVVEQPKRHEPFRLEPPSRGGTLSANTTPEDLDPPTDPLSPVEQNGALLDHQELSQEPAPEPPKPSMDLPSDLPAPVIEKPIMEEPIPPAVSAEAESNSVDPAPAPEAKSREQTLSELEAVVQKSYGQPNSPLSGIGESSEPVKEDSVASPEDSAGADLGDARDAVSSAFSAGPEQPLPPVMALNAQSLDIQHDSDIQSVTPSTGIELFDSAGKVEQFDTTQSKEPVFSMPENLVAPAEPIVDETNSSIPDPAAPPAVPPPFMPGTTRFGTVTDPAAPPLTVTQPPKETNNPFNLPPA